MNNTLIQIPWDTILKFVSKDFTRPMLQKPFIVDGKMIGTDGRRLLSVYCADYPEHEVSHQETLTDQLKESVRNLVNCDIGNPSRSPEDLFTIDPNMLHREESKCESCDKSGREPKWIECKKCYGDGEIQCECCGSDVECKGCNGIGEIKSPTETQTCSTCDGTKLCVEFIPDKHRAYDNGPMIKCELLWPIVNLPGVQFVKTELGTPIPFFGPGYSGCIMPIREY